MLGEHFDAVSGDEQKPESDAESGRRFVGVHFDCCDVYTRVYINREQSAYLGHCPRCAKQIRLSIGPGGSESRFFNVK
jgi:hypothetical protein